MDADSGEGLERGHATVRVGGHLWRMWGLVVAVSAGSYWLADSLAPNARALAAVFCAVVVLWISELLPLAVTALLVGPALVLLGITDAETAFAPYADPLLFLFVGGFFLAKAMARHGLDRRIARAIVGLSGSSGGRGRTIVALAIAGIALSMWISNTATAAILVPIALGLMDAREANTRRDRPMMGARELAKRQSQERGGDDEGTGRALLVVAYACSVGGLGTLVGSPPNLITARFLEAEGLAFGFVEWAMVGLPASLILGLMVLLVAGRGMGPRASARAGAAPTESAEALEGPRAPARALLDASARAPREADRRRWSRGERITALAFGLAVLGWVLPSVLALLGAPFGAALKRALPGGVVALLASSVLFAARAPGPGGERERVLPWAAAAEIDWGVILLFGGGISLGRQMLETGLALEMASWILAGTGVEGLWPLTALAIVFTLFFTETCSNTASSNILVPIVLAAAHELGVSALPPALGVGLAASCAFMLPIATGPNAVVYGTGRVRLGSMMRAGLLLNVLAAAVIFLLLRVLALAYGWQ
ncbi:MAG: SLC13 family permease [Myxococcales bacterium]|nr:SLC13 family permease [Myxococcales bacterium]